LKPLRVLKLDRKFRGHWKATSGLVRAFYFYASDLLRIAVFKGPFPAKGQVRITTTRRLELQIRLLNAWLSPNRYRYRSR